MNSVFVPLTHHRTSERVYVRADQIMSIRVKGSLTLAVTSERGMYVNEDAELIRDMADSILVNTTVIIDKEETA